MGLEKRALFRMAFRFRGELMFRRISSMGWQARIRNELKLIARLYKQYIVNKSFKLLLLWKSRNTSVTARLDR